MDEEAILNEMLPELNRVLNFSNIKLYLLKHHLLSMADVQELDKTGSRADLTTNLVAMLEQRTKNPAQKMLDVLRDIVRNNDGSEALEDMIEQLQRKLKSAALRAAGVAMRSHTPADHIAFGESIQHHYYFRSFFFRRVYSM